MPKPTKRNIFYQQKTLLSIGAAFIASLSLLLFVDLSPNTINYISTDVKSARMVLPKEPLKLIIDAIGVDASIQHVGQTQDGHMGIPTNFTDVAWYKGGPRPGMLGSSVIVGHLDGIKTPKAVFYDIDKLVVGDIVVVEDGGEQKWRFKVVKRKIYDYDAPTEEIFFGDKSKSSLNLITCDGDWIKSQKLYNKRLVVFTELVSP